MRILRVYLDTSVLGGCFDEEFAEDSNRILQSIRDGKLLALTSEVVVRELTFAPPAVIKNIQDLPPNSFETIDLSDENLELRDAYLAAGILGPRWADDLLHVAIATVSRADAIVSWNFRHIVRLDKIKAYNRVNFEMGYGSLTIVSPKEIRFDE